MSENRIYISIVMILRMLFRRRIVLILLIVIPVVFLSVVSFTTSDRVVPFRLASLKEEKFIEVSEKEISLLFFSVASVGFLVSFLALNLIQKNSDLNRRLIICGYHPLELLLSNFISLFLLNLLISIYVGLLSRSYFNIDHLGMMIFGLALTGFVYGGYGMAVGSLIKGELEGILLIVLLVNIDAGWLQNPLFYAEAQNQIIIRYLPAYFPSQTSIIASFTGYSGKVASFKSLLYGFGFLLISMMFFISKMHIRK